MSTISIYSQFTLRIVPAAAARPTNYQRRLSVDLDLADDTIRAIPLYFIRPSLIDAEFLGEVACRIRSNISLCSC
jgi:hypothetical protein